MIKKYKSNNSDLIITIENQTEEQKKELESIKDKNGNAIFFEVK
jgi:hypothetical protein